jgi:hypothetical protein
MPAFRLDDSTVGGSAATASGCSYYPFSGSTLKTLARDAARYRRTKGSWHLTIARPLANTLVKKLIRTRLAEGK